jgi:putative two-component system response regulator
MAKILIVDDESAVRKLLCHMINGKEHSCTPAGSAEEARKHLEEDDFDLALCDINMPGESGIDLARHIARNHTNTAPILATAVDDPLVADAAFKLGVYDYITKPLERNRVLISIANALRRRDLELANRTYRENLEQMVAERTTSLKDTMKRLRQTLDGIVDAMALTVETRDPYTAGHQRRVADLSCAIAREMGISEEQEAGVRTAGTIHDLGKITVPAEILSKPGRISEAEFTIIKTHPQVGYEILKGIEFPWPVAEIALQHHERMNGSGYPRGLKGQEILQEARIVGVADVVEAMASHRPYRPALGIDKALEEIRKNRGVLYDPEVVDACVRVFEEGRFSF